MADPVVLVHPNDAQARVQLDLARFMGTWHVTHSTLPLWKNKKDVTITYKLKTPMDAETIQFDDTVEYRASAASASSSPNRVVGVDTLVSPTPETAAGSIKPGATAGPANATVSDNSNAAAADADEPGLPAPRFKWRGRGWLAIATSRWRVLGCSADVEDPARAWAVTYFEKTLFTPAGLDVYAREPGALPREVVVRILEEAKRLEGEAGRLAEGFFEVARSGR